MANMRSAKSAAALLVAGLVLGLAAPRLGAAEPGAARPVQTHVVAEGESLWRLAARYAPGQDPRSFVEQVRRLNDLGVAPVQPGQRLRLPI